MNITSEEAQKLLDGTTPGPWRYRPHKHDDWGVVRGGVFNDDWGGYPHLAQVRDPDKMDDPILNAHRASGKDPWEANARLTAASPDLARTVIALHAELAQAHADAKAAVAVVVEKFKQAIADIPTPVNEDIMRGHEDAYRALEAIAPEDAIAEVAALRFRASAARWNVDEVGRLVRLCRGDHEKGEDCSAHDEVFVPVAERDRLAAELAAANAREAGLRSYYDAVEAFEDKPWKDDIDVMAQRVRDARVRVAALAQPSTEGGE